MKAMQTGRHFLQAAAARPAASVVAAFDRIASLLISNLLLILLILISRGRGSGEATGT